jgi:hypothetical protein
LGVTASLLMANSPFCCRSLICWAVRLDDAMVSIYVPLLQSTNDEMHYLQCADVGWCRKYLARPRNLFFKAHLIRAS